MDRVFASSPLLTLPDTWPPIPALPPLAPTQAHSSCVLWIRFEEMKANLPAVAKRVAAHLGLQRSDEELAAVATRCGFDSMKAEVRAVMRIGLVLASPCLCARVCCTDVDDSRHVAMGAHANPQAEPRYAAW